MIVIKFIIAILIWMGVDWVCENIPFNEMQKHLDRELTQYDYFHFYGTVWMLGFVVIIVLLSLF
jgi:hypothetical protein